MSLLERDSTVRAWAASGAADLTGRPDGLPLSPSPTVVEGLWAIGAEIERWSSRLGPRIEVDPLRIVTERATLSGFRRQGDLSCSGGTRLLPAEDGWLAVTLARPDDVASVPAWLEIGDVWADEVWDAAASEIARRSSDQLISRARLLGMPVARLPNAPAGPVSGPFADYPVSARAREGGDGAKSLDGIVVADLSSLWAGPLCTRILRSAGARVLKVESTRRPDGARLGPRAFFELLNDGKHDIAIDVTTSAGQAMLRDVLTAADVVVEASRPRALEQLGIWRDELMRSGKPRVWVSITGYGREGPDREAVAFGDDAAVAGGLVVYDEAGPCFCADAIADPATGLAAAAATLAALASPGQWTVDLAMRDVSAFLAAGAAVRRAKR